MDVLVFSTSVGSKDDVKELTPLLNSFAGKGHWNFALDDSDRILRIVSSKVDSHTTIQLLNDMGYQCRELDD
jgi:hypothetical protein